jgi:hypothetical protein
VNCCADAGHASAKRSKIAQNARTAHLPRFENRANLSCDVGGE